MELGSQKRKMVQKISGEKVMPAISQILKKVSIAGGYGGLKHCKYKENHTYKNQN